MKQIYTNKEVISDVLIIKETSLILQLPGHLKPYLWTAYSVRLVITKQKVDSFEGKMPRRHFVLIKYKPRINFVMYVNRPSSPLK